MVSGPRSSCSLHCVHSACETMFAASEMVGPLVSEGAVVSECAVYRERWFRGGQWCPIQLFFALRTQCLAPWFRRGLWFLKEPLMHCVRNAWPPGFGGGCCFGNVHANTDEMSVFVSWCWCLFCPVSCAAQGLGVSFQAESLCWRVHCPLRHRSLRNQAATELSPTQHARVSYDTKSRETTNATNRHSSSALDI